MSEFEIIKAAGPVGIGFFAGYLFLKEVFGFVNKRKNINGNGMMQSMTIQKIYETLVEMKSESAAASQSQIKLLQKLTKID